MFIFDFFFDNIWIEIDDKQFFSPRSKLSGKNSL